MGLIMHMRKQECKDFLHMRYHVAMKQDQPTHKRGRKPISATGELMKNRVIRMSDEDWEKCLKLGGADWIRKKVRAAKVKEDQ